MKIKLLVLATAFLATATFLRAATNDLSGALQKGLFEEEANRNLDAAIQAYQSVAARFDKDRQLAATAIFRLGECYRKLGKTNEAVLQYNRIVREFSDQSTLVTLSRQNLAGMGNQNAVASAGHSLRLSGSGTKDITDEAQMLAAQLRGLEQMKADPEQQANAILALFPDDDLKRMLIHLPLLRAQEKQLKTNASISSYAIATSGAPGDSGYAISAIDHSASPQEHLKKQIDFITQRVDLILRSQKARLQVLQSVASGIPAQEASAAEQSASATDEEKEIRRIQAMVKDSPDLINAIDFQAGATPLHYAAGQGQLKVAEFLLANGASTEAKDRAWGGQTPLHYAASSGHKAMVELLLSKKAEVQSVDNNGKTPLLLAALKGNKSVIEVLMAHGADVNAKTKAGSTALHIAAANSFKSVAELLLAHGADVNANMSREILTLSNDQFSGTPLHIATKRGDQAMAELLLANKAKLNAQNDAGGISLLVAEENGHDALVGFLLARGADVNISDKNGTTPLLRAVANDRVDIVRVLLEHKANPDVPGLASVDAGRNYLYNYPLRVAIEKGNAEILKMLLENGANPNFESTKPEKYVEGALFAAIRKKQNDAVELLLKFKADPNRVDKDGFSPLMRAIEDQNKEIAALLVNGGADVNLAERRGASTALHWAVGYQNKEITALLLAQGADPNKQDTGGQTPLDRAKSQNSTKPSLSAEIAGLLRQHGALDDLPKLDRIEVRRPSTKYSATVFWKGTNGWNEFTILELIAVEYGLLATKHDARRVGSEVNPWKVKNERGLANSLPFPDFSRVVIRRPSGDGRKRQAMEVDVAAILQSGECSKDVPLNWGDVVEIPETDHPINEQWAGFSLEALDTLKICLTRKIVITVKDQTVPLSLFLRIHVEGGKLTELVNNRSFGLWPVLDESKLLRASFDLSRVRVTRHDSATGQTREWLLDCSNPQSPLDLWLRDGDVIEVPDKP